jgi:hypothetical protein
MGHLMASATLTTTTPGEWKPGVTAGPNYCSVGQHFIGANERVWRYWTSPLVSRNCVCATCAGDTTTKEERHG